MRDEWDDVTETQVPAETNPLFDPFAVPEPSAGVRRKVASMQETQPPSQRQPSASAMAATPALPVASAASEPVAVAPAVVEGALRATVEEYADEVETPPAPASDLGEHSDWLDEPTLAQDALEASPPHARPTWVLVAAGAVVGLAALGVAMVASRMLAPAEVPAPAAEVVAAAQAPAPEPATLAPAVEEEPIVEVTPVEPPVRKRTKAAPVVEVPDVPVQTLVSPVELPPPPTAEVVAPTDPSEEKRPLLSLKKRKSKE